MTVVARLRTIGLTLAWGLAGLLIVVVGGLAAVLNSTTALEYAVDVAERATDQRLTVSEREGTLAGPVDLGGIRWRDDGVDVAVERLRMEWHPGRLLFGRIAITRLHLDGVRITTEEGRTPVAEPGPTVAATPPPALPVPVQINELRVTDLQPRLAALPERWAGPFDLRTRLKLVETVATVEGLVLETPTDRLALDAHGDWRQHTFTARAELAAITPWGEAVLDADLHGGPERIELAAFLAGPAELDATGHVTAPFADPAVDVDLRLDGLAPALTENLPMPLLVRGDGHLRGDRESLTWRGQLHADGADWGVWHSDMALRLEEGRYLQVPRLAMRRLDGDCFTVDAEARGDRVDRTFETRLRVSDIDPARLPPALPSHPELSGNLNLQLEAEGRLDATPRVALRELALDGDWLGHPLTAHAEGHWTPDDWHLAALDVTSGPNTLAGEARKRDAEPFIDLMWSLPAPGRLVPGLGGAIDGRLTYRDDALSADVEAVELAYGDHRLAAADLALRGSASATEWRLSTPAPELTLYGEADWADEPRLQLAGGRGHAFGSDWFVSHPWTVTLEAPKWELTSGCLAIDSGGELCLEGSGVGTRAGLRMELDDLALPPLVARHVPGAGLQQGTLDGRARLDWADGLEALEVDLSGDELYWQQAMPDDLPLTSRLDGLDISATYAPDRGLAGEATVRAEAPRGALRLALALPLWEPGADPAAMPLAGRLDGTLAELDWIGGLAPGFIRTSGRLETDLAIAGRLAEPRFAGRIEWREGRLQAPEIGLELTELETSLTATTFGVPLTLNGRARAHRGDLRLSGELVSTLPLALDVHLQGEGARLASTPEVQLLADPDLHLALRPGHVRVDGQVVIPEARIDLPERGGVVQPSADVIRLDETAPEATTTVSADVRVVLGPRVRLRGHGFEGRLEGDLRILEEAGQPPRGRGELVIREGRYRAWGQNLRIDDGRLLFADSPLDNPGLDIRAVRHGIPVTAGVRITGRARSPELVLFSEPPMDDTDILSYVVLGRPISQSGAGDGEQLAQAATALQLAGGARIARTIGERFGLDEVALEAGTTPEETALVLGTWLSPRLHLRYAIGITEDINTLRANYLLTDHWSLETETGPARVMDLLYTIDR